MRPIIKNAKGEVVQLTQQEEMMALHNEKHIKNALGFEIPITTLTTIMKSIVEQKFFEIAPADYMPVRVGEGAWSSNLETYRSYAIADDFASGIINTGGNNARLAAADAGVDSVTTPVYNWAKSVGWSLPELQLAAKSGNWDLVTAKEGARKKNWDLGIQLTAFLGLKDNAAKGLLNLSGVNNNTSIITETISGMTATELSTMLSLILGAYRANCNYTAWPTHFVIPESDYLGLAVPTDPTFPLRSKLSLIEETFKVMTKNPNFKVLPCAYGDQSSYFGGSGNIRYALYNSNPDTLRMDIPVDYNNTLQNTIDGFSYQNVGYGQFTGVTAFRPLEILYFTH